MKLFDKCKSFDVYFVENIAKIQQDFIQNMRQNIDKTIIICNWFSSFKNLNQLDDDKSVKKAICHAILRQIKIDNNKDLQNAIKDAEKNRSEVEKMAEVADKEEEAAKPEDPVQTGPVEDDPHQEFVNNLFDRLEKGTQIQKVNLLHKKYQN